MKIACSKCGTEYPRTKEYFIPAQTCVGGISRVCRACRGAAHAKYAVRNRERINERTRIWRHAKGGRDVERQSYRKRWDTNPLRRRAAVLIRGISARVKEFGLPLDVDLVTVPFMMDWLTRQPNCECCGQAFQIAPGTKGRPHPRTPSVDRIIPKNGYVKNNVALLCCRCNMVKLDATPDELNHIATWLRRQLFYLQAQNDPVPFRKRPMKPLDRSAGRPAGIPA